MLTASTNEGPISEATSQDTYRYTALIKINSINYMLVSTWKKTDCYWTITLNATIPTSPLFEYTIDDLSLEITDEFALKYQIDELKAENAELKTQITEINNKLSSFMTKSIFSEVVTKSFSHYIYLEKKCVDYQAEAIKHIYYCGIAADYFQITFREKEYPNAKFLVMRFYSYYTEYLFVYDFTTNKGHFIGYHVDPNDKNYEPTRLLQMVDFEGEVAVDPEQEKEVLWFEKSHDGIGGTDIGVIDDYIENTPDYTVFFRIIDTTDETMTYAQLLGAVMNNMFNKDSTK